ETASSKAACTVLDAATNPRAAPLVNSKLDALGGAASQVRVTGAVVARLPAASAARRAMVKRSPSSQSMTAEHAPASSDADAHSVSHARSVLWHTSQLAGWSRTVAEVERGGGMIFPAGSVLSASSVGAVKSNSIVPPLALATLPAKSSPVISMATAPSISL